MIWKAKGFKFEFPRQTLVMGIINLTPDSFSGDGLGRSSQKAVEQAKRMEVEGADLLDLGAESTRPGARPLSWEKECKRLLPVLEKIRKAVSLPLSIDTRNSETARRALQEGAQIINDVSSIRQDPDLAEVLAHHKAGLILMHSRGNPKTMSKRNRYQDLIGEIMKELRRSIEKARTAGIPKEAIMVDPGVGFAKVGEQNWKLLRSIERFRKIGYPICLGVSRKSFLGRIVQGSPQERDWATTALHGLLVERGVNILRVHSVQPAKQAVLAAKEFLKKA